LLVGFVSSGSYSYPCLRPQSQQQFDQCDLLEEEIRVRTGGKGAPALRSHEVASKFAIARTRSPARGTRALPRAVESHRSVIENLSAQNCERIRR
jgi:hypothetical protein